MKQKRVSKVVLIGPIANTCIEGTGWLQGTAIDEINDVIQTICVRVQCSGLI